MELKVFTEDGISRIISGVTEHTTCRDVMVAVAQATGCEGTYSMVLLWGNVAKNLSPKDKPMNIVKNFAESSTSVRFLVKVNKRRLGNKIKSNDKAVKTPILNIDKPIPQKQYRLKKSHTFNAPTSTKSFMNNYKAAPTNQKSNEGFNIDQPNVRPTYNKIIGANLNEPLALDNADLNANKQTAPPIPAQRTSLYGKNVSNLTNNMQQSTDYQQQNNFQQITDNTRHLIRSDKSAFKPLVAASKNMTRQQHNASPIDHNNAAKKSKQTQSDLLKEKLHEKMSELQLQQEQMQQIDKEIRNLSDVSESNHIEESKIRELTLMEQRLEAEIDELEIVSWKEKVKQEQEKTKFLDNHQAELKIEITTIEGEILKVNTDIKEIQMDIENEEKLSEMIQEETKKMTKSGDEQIEELKSELSKITAELNKHNEHINGQLIDISQKQNILNT